MIALGNPSDLALASVLLSQQAEMSATCFTPQPEPRDRCRAVGSTDQHWLELADQEISLSPTIPAMIKNRQAILNMSRDSLNKTIPRIATPTAPIPVHTA